MGLIRYKTLSPAGAPHDDATHLKWAGQVGVPLQGVFFLGDGFPMALPWAGKVPFVSYRLSNYRGGLSAPKGQAICSPRQRHGFDPL
jgi:hypothetical protein